MKREQLLINLISLFVLFVPLSAFSQISSSELGKYSYEELQLKRYANDTIAEAIVLSDIGKSYFINEEGTFYLYFERTTKYKILSEAGLKYAEISIPFYTGDTESESIESIKGSTANWENGECKVIPLVTKNNFIEKHSEYWSSKKIAMPNVKVGSVFEINYLIKSPFIFNLRSWEFQSTIPVVFSEYTTKMVPFYSYTYMLQGASKFDDYKSYEDRGVPYRFGGLEYQNMIYIFTMRNLPAFRDEEFITSSDDYIIKLKYQLATVYQLNGSKRDIMTTWPKLCDGLLDNESFGKYIKQCSKKAEEIILSLNVDTFSLESKAKLVDQYVKSNFNWNGYNSKFSNKTAKEFLLKKTGNSAEINLFLVSMLRAVGIDAQPVVLSTRDHGKIYSDYPFEDSFNYVIARGVIDNEVVFFDATEPLCSYNELPSRCINDKGLVIQEDKVEWAEIKSITGASSFYTFELFPDPINSIVNQKCKVVYNGFDAMNYRRKYVNSNEELRKSFLGDNVSNTDSLLAFNLNKIENPFELSFANNENLDFVDDKIIIRPFSDLTIDDNPMKQPVRKYPIDFIYKRTYKYRSTVTIPEGYKLIKLGEPLTINNDKITVNYNSFEKNKTIVVEAIYRFKKDVYPASDYINLKIYYDMIIDKFNQSVILGKE